MHKLGSNKNIIAFLHGGGARFSSYLPLFKSLSINFSVYFFDLPGHGSVQTDGNIENAILYITNQIKQLHAQNITLIGHSFGGFCAFETGKHLANVSKIILFDPLLTRLTISRINLLYTFLIKKNARGLFFHPNLWRYYLHAFKDFLINIASQKQKAVNTVKLLLESAYIDKIVDTSYVERVNLAIFHGSRDSIIHLKDFPPILQDRIKVIKGEHDWLMDDVAFTKKLIIEEIER